MDCPDLKVEQEECMWLAENVKMRRGTALAGAALARTLLDPTQKGEEKGEEQGCILMLGPKVRVGWIWQAGRP